MTDLAPATDAEIRALWRVGILSWKLWPQQLKIYNTIRELPTKADTVVILCARQFGKSVLSLLMCLEDCLQNENVLVLIVAPDLKQGQKIVSQRMKLLCRDAPKGLIKPVKSENKWEFPSSGSTLQLGGYSARCSSERGQTVYRIVLEEFGPDTDGDAYSEFLRSEVAPALQHSPDAKMIFPTTLPLVPDHPFVTETVPEAQSQGAYFEFTIEDNDQLTREQKDKAIKMAGGRGSIECERELFCAQVRDPSVVVVPSYDEKVHVREFELPTAYFMCVTGDQGGTRDKTVWLLHLYEFHSDRHLIWDELAWDANTPSAVMIKQARERWGADLGRPKNEAKPDGTGFDIALDAPPRQLVDNSAADVKDLDFNARTIPDKDDWRANVNQMADKFLERRGGEGAIWVHPRCKFLRLSLRSGRLNKTRDDFARTKVLGHCDALAALMYALRTVRRDNPYPAERLPAERVFKREQPATETEAIAEKIQPKTFGTGAQGGFQPKRFGKFKG